MQVQLYNLKLRQGRKSRRNEESFTKIPTQRSRFILIGLAYIASLFISIHAQDRTAFANSLSIFNSNKNSLSSGSTSQKQNAYTAVENSLNQFINLYPSSILVDDAWLVKGEAARIAGIFDKALSNFSTVLSGYRNSFLSDLFFTNDAGKTVFDFQTKGNQDIHSTFVTSDSFAQFKIAGLYNSSSLFPTNYNIEKSNSEFEKLISLYPHSVLVPAAYNNIAENYDAINNYSLSINNYEKLAKYNYMKSNYFTGKAFGSIGDISNAQGYISILTDYKIYLAGKYSATDYIAESWFQYSANRKWLSKSITVSFSRSGTNLTVDDEKLAADLLAAYNSLLSGRIQFSRAANNGNIQIQYKDGIVNNSISQANIEENKIEEITGVNISVGDGGTTKHSYEKRKLILYHEFGHALGLGHSFNSSDIMYFNAQLPVVFSARDISTIDKLYPSNNAAPEIISAFFTPFIAAGETIFYDVNAQDLNGDFLSFSIKNKPSWLNIEPVSGKISGTPTLSNLGKYDLEISVTDNNGGNRSKILTFIVFDRKDAHPFTAVLNDQMPTNFKLHQNYPNPFNPTTKIKYEIPQYQNSNNLDGYFVTLKIYDALGREISVLVDQSQSAGIYEITFNAASLPAGVYYYQLKMGNFCESRKLVLLK